MSDDEKSIRALVASWLAATKARDVDTVLSLMSDDVLFLQPGQPEMRKAEFAAKARAQAGPDGPQIDATSDIQEVRVLGEWAFIRTRLEVVATPPGGGQPSRRSGHTLSILRKQDGKWRLARDANLLA